MNESRAPSSRGRDLSIDAMIHTCTDTRAEPPMRIHHSEPTEDSTTIPNAMLQDEQLSFAARGLLAEMLSEPDDWEANGEEISRRARRSRGEKIGEGRAAIAGLLTELESLGYLVRRRAKDAQGLFVRGLDVYDTPGHQDPDARRSIAHSRKAKHRKGQYIYRHWDDDGRLLYVGISDKPYQRERWHAANSPWMEFQVEMTVEACPSRTEAEAAEAAAIASEQPLFNVAGNESAEAQGRLRAYLLWHGRTDLLAPAVSRG